MPTDSYLKISCPNCAGHFEYPQEAAGQTVACPHCKWDVELPELAKSKANRIANPSRTFLVFLIGMAGIVAIAVGWWAVRKNLDIVQSAKRDSQKAPVVIEQRSETAKAKVLIAKKVQTESGLVSGNVTLEKSDKSRLIYAAGTVQNTSTHQAFAVKVELDLFDANQNKIGSATDYTPVIEPGKEWKFKALVTDAKVVRVEVSAIKEN